MFRFYPGRTKDFTMFRHIIKALTPQRIKDAQNVNRANRALHLVLTERQQMASGTYFAQKDAA